MSEARTAPRGAFLAALADRFAARARTQVQKSTAEIAAFYALRETEVVTQNPSDHPAQTMAAEPPRRAKPIEMTELYGRSRPSDTSASADPVWLAQTCQDAGYNELTFTLMKRGASVADVEAELARAKAITQTAHAFGLPHMAATAIRGGVGLDTFREIITSVKADTQVPIVTASNGGHGRSKVKAPDNTGIYGRLNRAGGEQGR